MKRAIVWLLLSGCCSLRAAAGNNYALPGFSTGVAWQQKLYIDAAFTYQWQFLSKDEKAPAWADDCFTLKLGAVCNTAPKQFVYGPQLTAEYQWQVLGARLGITDYIGHDKTGVPVNDLRVTPEIGISLLGVFTLMGGYNIPLGLSHADGLSRGRVSLCINFGQLL